jgi:Family of unknown function (DUF6522)
MRIELDDKGDILLEPDVLATKLSLKPEALRRRMRLGLVTSLIENGEGEHAGLRRITVRCGAHSWQAILDTGGHVVDEPG